LVDSNKLQIEGRVRELALFNLAIDSKLRGCDLVGLRVEDIAPTGMQVTRRHGAPEEVDDALAIAEQVEV